MHLYKATEWKGGCGNWYCSDVEDLGNWSGAWWIPARILEISLTDFVKMLINEFNVSYIHYSEEYNFLHYHWKNQADMRRYKNMINAAARKKNFRF